MFIDRQAVDELNRDVWQTESRDAAIEQAGNVWVIEIRKTELFAHWLNGEKL